MLSQRWRPFLIGIVAIGILWAGALTAYHIAQNAKVTPDKVRNYLNTTDFAHLTGNARSKALRRLADMLNSLSLEDRRKAHLDKLIAGWFDQMTEAEKSAFLEATLPTGFKQMLTAFEQMPEEKRTRAVDDALKRMRMAEEKAAAAPGNAATATNQPPVSKELEAQVRSAGLKTFYSESSARTKAELAPVLEELQRSMESGRVFRGQGR